MAADLQKWHWLSDVDESGGVGPTQNAGEPPQNHFQKWVKYTKTHSKELNWYQNVYVLTEIIFSSNLWQLNTKWE